MPNYKISLNIGLSFKEISAGDEDLAFDKVEAYVKKCLVNKGANCYLTIELNECIELEHIEDPGCPYEHKFNIQNMLNEYNK